MVLRYLAYESGELHGMTKPIQELLHQLTMVVANLVSMSERIFQLDQIDQHYRLGLEQLHQMWSVSYVRRPISTNLN
jgi:hypothetical protein